MKINNRHNSIRLKIFSLKGAIMLDLMFDLYEDHIHFCTATRYTGFVTRHINYLYGRGIPEIMGDKGIVKDTFKFVQFNKNGEAIVDVTDPLMFTPRKLLNMAKRFETSFRGNVEYGSGSYAFTYKDKAKNLTTIFGIDQITSEDVTKLREVISNPDKFSNNPKYADLIGNPMNPFEAEVFDDVIDNMNKTAIEYYNFGCTLWQKVTDEYRQETYAKLKVLANRLRKEIKTRDEILKNKAI